MKEKYTPRNLKQNQITPLRVYIALSFLCFAALLIIFAVTRGTWVERFFFWDTADTGMDFFHSIEYVHNKHPYQDFYTLYPPLANLMFYGIFKMMPPEVTANWNLDFYHSLSMRQTSDDLRVHQAPMIMFIIFVAVVAALIVTITREYLKEKGALEANLAPFAILLSYGMLCGLERGNIIILTWILILCYLAGYQSENKIVKELSLISLAIGFGLKLYPAFFGLLLLQKKDFKAAIRTCIYGIACIVLPYLVLFEGVEGIKTWFSATRGYGTHSVDALGNSMPNILATFKGATKINLNESLFGPATIVTCLVMMASSFFQEKEWKKVLAILMSMVLLSYQGEYIYMLFGIPMLLAFKSDDAFTKDNILEYICMIILMIPLPIFYIHAKEYPHNVLAQLCLVFLAVKIFVDAVRKIVDMKKNTTKKAAS